MSTITANVTKIESQDSLNLIYFDFKGTQLIMMSLEMQDKLSIGQEVLLGIKPTSVTITKAFSTDISIPNKIPMSVLKRDDGTLLSSLTLQVDEESIESIMIKSMADSLEIKHGDKVLALIHASALSIIKVRDD